jgi:hypothetical protein
MATQPDAGHLSALLAAQTISRVLRQIDADLPFAFCGEVASSIYRGSCGAPVSYTAAILTELRTSR